MRPLVFFVVFLVLCSLVGCSGYKQVKGKVTLTDGTPLGNGRVVFEKEGFAATGEIKSDGSYVMGSKKDNDGVPPGAYTVYVTHVMKTGQDVEVSTGVGADGSATKMRIPSLTPIVAPKHRSAETSDIKCDVKKSMTFNFQVEPSGL